MELLGHPHSSQLVSHASGLGSAFFHLLRRPGVSLGWLIADQPVNINF
jgi:hypothetical protein